MTSESVQSQFKAHKAFMDLAHDRLFAGLSQLDKTRLQLLMNDETRFVKAKKEMVNWYAFYSLNRAANDTAKFMAEELGCNWVDPG